MVIYNTTILYVYLPVPTSGTGIFSTDLIPSSHTMVPRSNPQIFQINNTWKKLQKSKEELTSFFTETILILDQEIADRGAELAEYKRIYGELKPTSHN